MQKMVCTSPPASLNCVCQYWLYLSFVRSIQLASACPEWIIPIKEDFDVWDTQLPLNVSRKHEWKKEDCSASAPMVADTMTSVPKLWTNSRYCALLASEDMSAGSWDTADWKSSVSPDMRSTPPTSS